MAAPIILRDPYLRYMTQFRDADDNPFPGLEPFRSLPQSKEGVAAVLMSYLVSAAFDVHRYPSYTDRSLSKANHKAVKKVVQWLRQVPEAHDILQGCIHELRRVNGEIQAWYRMEGRTTLRLYRRLGWDAEGPRTSAYIRAVFSELTAARDEGRMMQIDMDTVSHWTVLPNTYASGTLNLRLEREVAPADIVLCSDLIDHLEPNEVLILNRDPFGKMTLDPHLVEVRGSLPRPFWRPARRRER